MPTSTGLETLSVPKVKGRIGPCKGDKTSFTSSTELLSGSLMVFTTKQIPELILKALNIAFKGALKFFKGPFKSLQRHLNNMLYAFGGISKCPAKAFTSLLKGLLKAFWRPVKAYQRLVKAIFMSLMALQVPLWAFKTSMSVRTCTAAPCLRLGTFPPKFTFSLWQVWVLHRLAHRSLIRNAGPSLINWFLAMG